MGSGDKLKPGLGFVIGFLCMAADTIGALGIPRDNKDHGDSRDSGLVGDEGLELE
jgi:hypothetical protein